MPPEFSLTLARAYAGDPTPAGKPADLIALAEASSPELLRLPDEVLDRLATSVRLSPVPTRPDAPALGLDHVVYVASADRRDASVAHRIFASLPGMVVGPLAPPAVASGCAGLGTPYLGADALELGPLRAPPWGGGVDVWIVDEDHGFVAPLPATIDRVTPAVKADPHHAAKAASVVFDPGFGVAPSASTAVVGACRWPGLAATRSGLVACLATALGEAVPGSVVIAPVATHPPFKKLDHPTLVDDPVTRAVVDGLATRQITAVFSAGNVGLASTGERGTLVESTAWKVRSPAVHVGHHIGPMATRVLGPNSSSGPLVDVYATGDDVESTDFAGAARCFRHSSAATCLVGGGLALLQAHLASTGQVVDPRHAGPLLRSAARQLQSSAAAGPGDLRRASFAGIVALAAPFRVPVQQVDPTLPKLAALIAKAQAKGRKHG